MSDVVIIGGGIAGATAAAVLARQGIRVVLVDRWETYPECFKAEKIESDQAILLRKFQLLDTVLPWTGSIREVLRAQEGRIIRRVPTEQYGIFYHDMVNAIRGSLPASVERKIGRVEHIENSETVQTVTLGSGEVYQTRLVLVAAGVGGDFQAKLGLRKNMLQKEQSFAAGFNIERRDGRPFDFDSITYYPTGSASRIAFLTLFWIGKAMRANLFACWSNNEERARDFVRNPGQELARWLPQLTDLTGPFEISGKLETGRIDLYQMERPTRPGMVLVGDAFQSVCPITGTGLSKVLTDVDVLSECLPKWLATPGMSAAKLNSFYENKRKQEVDRDSLAGARYARQISTDDSLGWRFRRAQWHWENRFGEALAHLARATSAAVLIPR